MRYEWDFSVVWRSTELFLEGGRNSLWLFGSALAIALPLGLLLAVLRMSRLPVASHGAVAYIDLFRASPALVLVVWFYFALPILIGVELSAFTAAMLALGLQSAAYMAEVFRSGVESIGPGQREAAMSIGMRRGVAFQHIILPQAIKRTIPILFTRLIELLKSTALAAVITYEELVFNGTQVAAATFRPIETYTTVALVYFVVIFAASQATLRLERHLAASD